MAFFETSQWDGKLYLGGWRAGSGGKHPIFEPATGKEIGAFGVATADDVAKATEQAAAAGAEWAKASYEQRAAVLRRAGQLTEQYTDTLAYWLEREAGSAKGKAAFEIHVVANEFYEAAGQASLPYGRLLRSGKPRLSMSRRIPVGIVGVISPFNFPQILSMRSVAPALALGNAVILKPDPRTAVSGGLIFAQILQEAGLPEGLFHVLPGGADTGEALITEPGIRVISFTGSTRAGRAIARAAADRLKRVHLELGGNNALIVLGDVDVKRAASAGAWGSFLHQGQVCMTTGRHLVHASIYDAYVEALAQSANRLTVGDGATSDAALGPIIDAHQRDRIHSLVTKSVSAGAKLAAGGTYDGLFYRPTVLRDMKPEYPAFEEEVFGPVAPVMKFSSLDEAVDIVNRSEYGLSLAIMAKDPMAALELSGRMHSGIVHINDQTVDDEPTIPFGGVGASGTGSRFGGPEANLDAFTETQWVTVQGEIERYPF